MFGVVVVAVHRKPSWQPGSLSIVFEYALVAYSVLAVAIAAILKGRVAQEPELQRRSSMLLLGWALGESAALGGTLIYFVNGQAQWYALGLLAMLASFVLLSPAAVSPDADRLGVG